MTILMSPLTVRGVFIMSLRGAFLFFATKQSPIESEIASGEKTSPSQ